MVGNNGHVASCLVAMFGHHRALPTQYEHTSSSLPSPSSLSGTMRSSGTFLNSRVSVYVHIYTQHT